MEEDKTGRMESLLPPKAGGKNRVAERITPRNIALLKLNPVEGLTSWGVLHIITPKKHGWWWW